MQEDMSGFGAMEAVVRAFGADSESVIVADVTLPVWALSVVLVGVVLAIAAGAFFTIRY
jgi:hypothetical protein